MSAVLAAAVAAPARALPVLSYWDLFTIRNASNPLSSVPEGDFAMVVGQVSGVSTPDPLSSLSVEATQGALTVPLDFVSQAYPATAPDAFYSALIPLVQAETGIGWSITATDSTGTSAPVFAPPIADPLLLPFVTGITVSDTSTTPTVSWVMPDLTGFSVDLVRFRIIDGSTEEWVFRTVLPVTATSFVVPDGILGFRESYVYNLVLVDSVPGAAQIENESSAYSGLSQVSASPAPATFTKITTGDLVTAPASYWNGAWGDYDDDGYLDLFVGSTSASTTNYLYHNERDGTFALIDQAAMPKSPSNQHGAAWGDYDNDGHLDLIVTAGNPGTFHNMLYRNEGDGTFSWVTDGPLYTETRNGGFHAPSWADYDDDGFLDLFIAGHAPFNRLFHNQGDGSFARILDNAIVMDLGDAAARAFADYDDDGDLDLFVGNHNGVTPNFLYRNDGTGRFTPVTDSGLSEVAFTWGSSWADYDNDGFLDLFLANSERNFLYHNEGDGTFTRVVDSVLEQETLPPNHIFASSAWGDYDNDAFIDLFVSVGNCYPDPDCGPPFHNFLYHNEGDGTFTKVTEGIVVTDPITQCPGASWGDYDNDGFLDLFVSHGSFGSDPHTNLLYHNDGNANAWLDVKLVGTRSNRAAIGAKVRVQAFYRGQSRWQLREISGGDGESNQQSLNAEFGLADATNIDTLRVEWPSGAVQELHDVAPRQFLTLTEPLGNGKILVCHKGKKTKVIKEMALDAHLGHTDTEGFCPKDGAALVCHRGKKTKLARGRSLAAHVRHGDTMGACLD